MICPYFNSCILHDKAIYILNSYFIDCKNAISHFNYSWDSYDYIVLLLEQLSDVFFAFRRLDILTSDELSSYSSLRDSFCHSLASFSNFLISDSSETAERGV